MLKRLHHAGVGVRDPDGNAVELMERLD